MKTKIWLALLAIYLIWGSTYLAIRFTVETIPPFLTAGLRFISAGTLMYIWQRLTGNPAPTRRQWRDTAIIGLLLLLGGNGLVSWAEQYVPSGIAALLIGTVPMWMVLIESLRPRGVRPRIQAIAGLLIGFGGITLLVGPGELSSEINRLHPFGISALFTAALLWSLGSVFSKSADLPSSSLLTTAMEMLAGSVGLLLVSTLRGEWQTINLTTITHRSLYGLLYLSVFGSLIGFVSYAWLLRHAPISLVSTYAYVNPVIAVLLGSWIAAEAISSQILIAAAIIVCAVILINTARPSKPANPILEQRTG